MTKRIKISIFFFSLLTLFSIVFIFSNSLKNGEESYEQSKGLVEFIESIFDPDDKIPTEDFNFSVRKASHFLEFALLGFSFCSAVALACYTTGKYNICMPLLFGLFVAVIDEFIQGFTGRSSMVSDVLIDFAGVIFGVLVSRLAISLNFRKDSAKLHIH